MLNPIDWTDPNERAIAIADLPQRPEKPRRCFYIRSELRGAEQDAYNAWCRDS